MRLDLYTKLYKSSQFSNQMPLSSIEHSGSYGLLRFRAFPFRDKDGKARRHPSFFYLIIKGQIATVSHIPTSQATLLLTSYNK